jgi:hypothetical protein
MQTPEDEDKDKDTDKDNEGEDTRFLGEDLGDIFKERYWDNDDDILPMPEDPSLMPDRMLQMHHEFPQRYRKYFLSMCQTIRSNRR